MAKIIVDNKESEVADGELIKEPCEKLGVTIGCSEGFCGTCEIHILEGADNLGPLTEAERLMNSTKDKRLACQAKIKQGIVKVKFW